MLKLYKRFLVFLGIRLIWGVFSGVKWNALLQFEATEDDSAWQLIWAFNHVEDPSQKAQLFGQILEEAQHAEMFRKYILKHHPEKWSGIPGRMVMSRRALYSGEHVWKYFPYCVVGEYAAAARFSEISSSLSQGDSELKGVFDRIISDEVGHIHKARELANELGLPEEKLKKEIKNITLQRFWEQWLRSGRKILAPVAVSCVLFVYFIFLGPFHLFQRITR